MSGVSERAESADYRAVSSGAGLPGRPHGLNCTMQAGGERSVVLPLKVPIPVRAFDEVRLEAAVSVAG